MSDMQVCKARVRAVKRKTRRIGNQSFSLSAGPPLQQTHENCLFFALTMNSGLLNVRFAHHPLTTSKLEPSQKPTSGQHRRSPR